MKKVQRVIWVVLDGVGCGATHDSAAFGDSGANTLKSIHQFYQNKYGKELVLPTLSSLGLYDTFTEESKYLKIPGTYFGSCEEKSSGKDTSTGHWEMAGLEIQKPFQTYPNGFPKEVIQEWCQKNQLPGVLGNKPASGTEILLELGHEHIKTQKPILYTSADSVWQVAAHEKHFGLERLYQICHSAREICNSLQIGRVIARPFIGEGSSRDPFQRTYNRKDLSLAPPHKTILNQLQELKIPTLGIGKISSIYNDSGIDENWSTQGNQDGIAKIIHALKTQRSGLIFCNLIDFDMLYGHRRDPLGFANALLEWDRELEQILKLMTLDDFLIQTADHGNDPCFRGTDHTREKVPFLLYSKGLKKSQKIGTRKTFADIGMTVLHLLSGQSPKSFSNSINWIGESIV